MPAVYQTPQTVISMKAECSVQLAGVFQQLIIRDNQEVLKEENPFPGMRLVPAPTFSLFVSEVKEKIYWAPSSGLLMAPLFTLALCPSCNTVAVLQSLLEK
ncbi:hypothetical protein CRENBAI_015533 [Crenichthys baileyi]|uniref:Uncharacterized protein n=1 Tax=Crenichthys baileyi TaxID=28760 RepID=A0AAV9SD97_9TELE